MARQKQVAQEVSHADILEITVGRVKRDLVWVLASVVVSIGSGLIIGSFFKF